MSELTFHVPGMTCGHCEAAVKGEVGKVGVAIDSLDDMRTLLADLPLDKVTTSMTIDSTAAILLLMYELVAEERGVPSTAIAGTIQNDLLKEYIARGTYVYPPRPSMRVITDIFEYCSKHVPKWNTISISGYHIREAGSTAVMRFSSPNRTSPASASTMASYWPSSSLRSRVSTLPRRSSMFKSGRQCSN